MARLTVVGARALIALTQSQALRRAIRPVRPVRSLLILVTGSAASLVHAAA